MPMKSFFAVQQLSELMAEANGLNAAGKKAEAAELYRSALESCPADIDLLYEYGNTLLSLDQLDSAADCFRHALSIDPQDAACTIMLARTLQRLKKPLDALHFYRQGQRLSPHLSVLHLMSGVAAVEAELRDEARSSFARALEIDPENISARLCLCMMHLNMFSSISELEAGRSAYARALDNLVRNTRLDSPTYIEAAIEAVGMMSNFFLPYQGCNDRELQKVYGEWLCWIMAARFPDFQNRECHLAPGEKIRIGFVSAHFRDHSVWKIVTRGWMKYLDRDSFLLFGYYAGTDCDAATGEARAFSDVFVRETDAAVLAETIHSHKPHVLIYPGLGMDPNTIKLAALRLAPVQCVSWGHPETTGLPTMDYFLSSELMEPTDGDEHYSEELVRLPNLSICYEQLTTTGDLPVVTIPGVVKGDTSYLCCQNLMKYLPQHDDVFPAIASRVKRAKFVFIKFSEIHADCFSERMRSAFARFGLSSTDHVVFVPPLNGTGYAAMNAVTDIFLDSIGWAGGNTTFESLPFNKPIVTLPGEFMRGRHAAAILSMMGVEETIATDKQDYIDIAVRLGNDSNWCNAVSSRVAENKHRAYGDVICIRALENFLKSACFKLSYNAVQGHRPQ